MKSIVDYTNELKDYFASKQALTTKLSIADLTSISDCDNLPSNSIAFISNSATAHLPWAVRSTIITCEVLDSPVRKFQVAFTFNNEIYIRDYSGSWLAWKLVGADMGNNIAPVENGPNYSTSYTKGAQFINNGLLCEVTASSVNSSTAISIGGAGNAKYANSVTKQLGDIPKWHMVAESGSSSATYNAKLSSIQSAYSQLSAEAKQRSYLKVGSMTVAHPITVDQATGYYGVMGLYYAGAYSSSVYRISESNPYAYTVDVRTTGNTITEISTDTTTDNIQLYAFY